MKNYDSRINGRLKALDELYIPINANNSHWNLIRVAITNKTIQLIGSQEYLQAVENYMYGALTKNLEGQRQYFNIWKRDWTITDKSGASQRQEIEYD